MKLSNKIRNFKTKLRFHIKNITHRKCESIRENLMRLYKVCVVNAYFALKTITEGNSSNYRQYITQLKMRPKRFGILELQNRVDTK